MQNPLLPLLASLLLPVPAFAEPELPKIQEMLARYRKGNDLVHRLTNVRKQDENVRPLLLCEDLMGRANKPPDYHDSKSVTKWAAGKALDPKVIAKILKIPNILERPADSKVYTGPIKREHPLTGSSPMNGDAYAFVQDVHHLNKRRREELDKWEKDMLVPVLTRPLGVGKDSYVCKDDLGNLKKDLDLRVRLLERLSGRIAARADKHGRAYFSHHVWYIENVELRNYVVKYFKKDNRKWFWEGPNCDPLADQIRGISEGYAEQHAAAQEIVEYLNSQADALKEISGKLAERVKDCRSL